jgi:hypothetical protein
MKKMIDVEKLFSVEGFEELAMGVVQGMSKANIYRIIKSKKINEYFESFIIDKVKLIYPTEKFWESYDGTKEKNQKGNMAVNANRDASNTDSVPFCSTMQNDNEFFEK